jgi:thiol:disulfide interchange protein DsbG
MTVSFKRLSLATLVCVSLGTLAACHAPSSNPTPPLSTPAASAPAASTPVAHVVPLDKVQALVAGASHGTVKTLSVFAGKDGMTGVITQGQNRPKEIVWVSPDGNVLFPGPAFTIDGHNLTEDALTEQHVFISASELGDRVLSSSNPGFVVGTQGPVLTAFMDANCIWCHRFYQNVMPAVKAGKVRVRFVMVGILKQTSVPRAEAILSAKDPAAALDKDEKGFVESTEDGGIAPIKTPNPDLEAKIQSSVGLMADAGKVSTPGLLYCDKATQKPVYTQGYPMDFDGFIASLSTDGHAICSK